MSISESKIQQSGTYYLALHDLTDDLGQGNITVSYYNTSTGLAIPRGDVNGDGTVDVADIGEVISIMAALARAAERKLQE